MLLVFVTGIINSDDDFVSPRPLPKKRLEDKYEGRKVKRKLIIDENDKREKGIKRKDKREGTLRLVDEVIFNHI